MYPVTGGCFELTKTNPLRGSYAEPPQLGPPVSPGIIRLGGLMPSRSFHGVYGPLLKYFVSSQSLWSAPAAPGLVSDGSTMSSLERLTRATGGGFTGMGCVGEYHSPGTSP